MRRTAVRSAMIVLSVCAVLLAAPAAAAALTLEAPGQALDTLDVTVTVGSADPTGTVCVLSGGKVLASRLATPGAIVLFEDVDAGYGDVTLHASVKYPGGMGYSAPVTSTVWGTPSKPALLSPSGGYAAASTMVTARTGKHTTLMELRLNGKFVRNIVVAPGSVYPIAQVSLPKGTSTIALVVSNPMAAAEYTYTVKRLEFPWATCIIIDQSSFKLYWVRNGELVKTYPIAHGKASTPTPNRVWKILAKYHTTPTSVYGPRKMRLFKQTSSGYVYTAYAIHGTNQPWVIGTRASHGCIRMYNSDVLELFPQVPLGTMVQTRP